MTGLFRSIAYAWRTGGPRQLVSRAIARAGRAISRRYEAIVYQLDDLDVAVPALGDGVELRQLEWADLMDGRYFKAVHFPNLIQTRLAEGEWCVGVFFDGALGHVSWMTPEYLQIDRGIPLVSVAGGVGIYDMFTLPEFRGRGAQTNALLGLCRLADELGFQRAVALVREGNGPSRHVFRKCGFQEIGELEYRRRLWMETLEHPPL